ncbi:NlpC/P60 family protein [Krasilnikovia cinnamomea]|uniref:NlpC/P60 family protein n=1 Tax=Krasilnikovia cinnamomea TaxID=349313 RepID=A0A4Q7ZMD3_9ACTN|nr:peptidoglycan-binding domain-containing protein [Krasilnikovia cinnamomea]RZU51419.1 NlpC/P60 family protein [Krasilnikovia cinnamomea]
MSGEVYLRRGDSGDYVEQVQQRLTELGFSTGGVDRDYGRKTVEAVQAFQATYQLEITGQVDESTWGMLFSSHEGQNIAADDPTDVATADRFVELCLHQVNDRYVLGTNADENNPDEDEFDCAELISWACARLGVEFPSYSVSQIDASHHAGLGLSVSEAASVRGALLFRRAGHNGSQYNHVAVSLGTGDETIEAMGRAHGVAVGEIGNRFTDGGYIPGIQYH